jgi:pantoate--beta-alanine ligase
VELVRRTKSMKEICRQARANGRKIGLVPTMGSLHEGHLSLVRRVKELADLVVVSIFVNPTQFGEGEDLKRYPRDLAGDVDLCVAEEVDYVFAPGDEEIYPKGAQTFVEVRDLSEIYEGTSRPGHFRGVTTVVLKLFEIVKPTVAAFGQKDFQQAVVIRRMVRDLMLDVEVLVLPTVRDDDELALSSRNRYLAPEERAAALAIPRALEAARQAIHAGVRQPERVVAAASAVLDAEERLSVDYVALVDVERLEPLDQIHGETVIRVAASVGKTRLIDNSILLPG